MLAQKLDARIESLETVLMPLIARVADLETRAPVEMIRESSASESETGGQEGDDAKARKAKKAKKAKDRKNTLQVSDHVVATMLNCTHIAQDAVRRCPLDITIEYA